MSSAYIGIFDPSDTGTKDTQLMYTRNSDGPKTVLVLPQARQPWTSSRGCTMYNNVLLSITLIWCQPLKDMLLQTDTFYVVLAKEVDEAHCRKPSSDHKMWEQHQHYMLHWRMSWKVDNSDVIVDLPGVNCISKIKSLSAKCLNTRLYICLSLIPRPCPAFCRSLYRTGAM